MSNQTVLFQVSPVLPVQRHTMMLWIILANRQVVNQHSTSAHFKPLTERILQIMRVFHPWFNNGLWSSSMLSIAMAYLGGLSTHLALEGLWYYGGQSIADLSSIKSITPGTGHVRPLIFLVEAPIPQTRSEHEVTLYWRFCITFGALCILIIYNASSAYSVRWAAFWTLHG